MEFHSSRPRRWDGRTAALDVVVALVIVAVSVVLAAPGIDERGYSTIWYQGFLVGLLAVIPRWRWVTYVTSTAIAFWILGYSRDLPPAQVTIRVVADIAIVCVAAVALSRTRPLPLKTAAGAVRLIAITAAVAAVRAVVAWFAELVEWTDRTDLTASSNTWVLAGTNTIVGMLCLTPLAILGSNLRSWRIGTKWLWIHVAVLVVYLGALFAMYLAPSLEDGTYIGLIFLVIPVVMAIATISSQLALAMTLAWTAVTTAVAHSLGAGPFVAPEGGNLVAAVVNLQTLLIAVSVSAWLLAGSIASRRHAERLLEHELAEQIELVHRLGEADEMSRQLADYDSVTGLHSRSWLTRELEQRLDGRDHDAAPLAIMFIECHQHQLIRQRLGYHAGDDLMRAVAGEIHDVVAGRGELCRFDDRLALLIDPVGDLDTISLLVGHVMSVVRTEHEVDGHRLHCDGTIGVAVWTPASTAEMLLRDADLALATASAQRSTGWKVFDSSDTAELTQMALEEEISEALTRQEFIVYYQPQVRLSDRSIVGHEALVRWQHPTRGLVPPDQFIPAAERAGLIGQLGLVVLEQVCVQLAAHPEMPPIAVNVSAVQLEDADFHDRFIGVIRQHGVLPRRIIVELTETAIFRLTEHARDAITRLRAAGCGLHVDDFGTGFSSLAHLRDLPVTGLKLDKSFVSQLSSGSAPVVELVHGIAGLGNGLGLHTVAEGVETEEEAALLRATGWTYAQGYLFARPAPTVLPRLP